MSLESGSGRGGEDAHIQVQSLLPLAGAKKFTWEKVFEK